MFRTNSENIHKIIQTITSVGIFNNDFDKFNLNMVEKFGNHDIVFTMKNSCDSQILLNNLAIGLSLSKNRSSEFPHFNFQVYKLVEFILVDYVQSYRANNEKKKKFNRSFKGVSSQKSDGLFFKILIQSCIKAYNMQGYGIFNLFFE
jgi:hypothetical protein